MSLQKLQIEQEGVGKLVVQEEIPPFYKHYLLPGATAFFQEGDGIVAIFQVFIGKVSLSITLGDLTNCRSAFVVHAGILWIINTCSGSTKPITE